MTTQPNALRLAELIDWPSVKHGSEAASELRRLHEANQQMREMMDALNADRDYLMQANQELLEALKAVVHAEDARSWGVFGVDTKEPLSLARAAIKKHGEKA